MGTLTTPLDLTHFRKISLTNISHDEVHTFSVVDIGSLASYSATIIQVKTSFSIIDNIVLSGNAGHSVEGKKHCTAL